MSFLKDWRQPAAVVEALTGWPRAEAGGTDFAVIAPAADLVSLTSAAGFSAHGK